MAINEGEPDELIGRFVTDRGAAVHAVNAVIGDRLGLRRGLWELGPTIPERLARHTGTGRSPGGRSARSIFTVT